jgi:hypothetical protein
MNTPAVSIKSRQGVYGYGPKCAAVMGLIQAVQRAKARPARKQETSEDQMDWITDDTPA